MNSTPGHFRFHYHDAWLTNYRLGPRRELHLFIRLDPVWNEGLKTVQLRFSDIDHFEEVVTFFGTIPLPPAALRYVGEILQFKWSQHQFPGYLLELDRVGSLIIRTPRLTESCLEDAFV